MKLDRTSASGIAVLSMMLILLAGCGKLINPPARYGMVKNPETGLQFGSVVQRNFVTDASFFKNRRIKVRVRNTSGDRAFDLIGFKARMERAYEQAGYEPTSSDDFGLLLDVNVRYSGQIQTNLANEFSYLGATAGGLAGASHGGGIATASGIVAGATLGGIIGSFITDDTYIIIADVTIGVVRGAPRRDGKTIVFSRGYQGNPDEREEIERRRKRRGFKSTHRTGISVYAGGRNVRQSDIATEVRERFVRIIRDII